MYHINLGHALGAALAVASLISVEARAETTPAPAEISQEEAFLGILPEVEVPKEVRPIPGAVNEEFRNCQAVWPAGYELARSGPEARALRDIYGFIRVRNVIETRDCGCTGKVAKWEDVEVVAAALREQFGVERLSWKQTKVLAEGAAELTTIAETMCGGSF